MALRSTHLSSEFQLSLLLVTKSKTSRGKWQELYQCTHLHGGCSPCRCAPVPTALWVQGRGMPAVGKCNCWMRRTNEDARLGYKKRCKTREKVCKNVTMAVTKILSWLFPQLTPFILSVQFSLLMQICLLYILECILVTFFISLYTLDGLPGFGCNCCQMPS